VKPPVGVSIDGPAPGTGTDPGDTHEGDRKDRDRPTLYEDRRSVTTLFLMLGAFGAGYGARALVSYRRRRQWLAEMGIANGATRARRL
jgi:hypothetical protein